ncbi:MAG: hypothetical protein IJT97_00640 [Bacteroidaceae bacterium]|nr:hypothetical protein [Bacteroidaceae bacterium]
MKSKKSFILTTIFLAISLCLFTSCGKDDDDSSSSSAGTSSASIPNGLIGSWYKAFGDSRYSMNFTFNANGTGYGTINHNKIISYNAFTFTYTYRSNGDVVCTGTRAMADENGEETVSTTLTFRYNGNSLTLSKAANSLWEGSTFTK